MEARPRIVAIAAVATATACLPDDNRPPPTEITITATADAHLLDGISASEMLDGWAVTYDTAYTSLGIVSAEGGECTSYSGASYKRILDMKRAGPQKVNILHAIGTCVFDYELNGSALDSPVGEGVTREVQEFMLTTQDGPYAVEAGPTIYLAGRATKDGVEKTFSWPFLHAIDYEQCGPIVDGEVDPLKVEFEENGEAIIDVAYVGATPFQQSLYDEEPDLAFQPFADADTVYGNDDGEVTLDELALVPLTDIATADRYADANDEPPAEVHDKSEPDTLTTLGDYVYFRLFPLVPRLGGVGACTMDKYVNDRAPD